MKIKLTQNLIKNTLAAKLDLTTSFEFYIFRKYNSIIIGSNSMASN